MAQTVPFMMMVFNPAHVRDVAHRPIVSYPNPFMYALPIIYIYILILPYHFKVGSSPYCCLC